MKIRNLDGLKRKIAAMPKVAREEIRAALRVSAEEIVDTAKRFAPVRDGELRDSIDYTFGDYAPANANVRGVSAGRGGHDLAVTIHAGDERAFYAAWVEFGTKPHSVARGGGTVRGRKRQARMHPGARAQPFFWPAYRLGKKRAKSRIARSYGKAAKKVAAR